MLKEVNKALDTKDATCLSSHQTMTSSESWDDATTWTFLQLMLDIKDRLEEPKDSAFNCQVWVRTLELFQELLEPIASSEFIGSLTVERLEQAWEELKYGSGGAFDQEMDRSYPLERPRTFPASLVQDRIFHSPSLSYENMLKIHRQQNAWFLKQQDQLFQRFHTAMTGQSGDGRLTAFEEFQLKRKTTRLEEEPVSVLQHKKSKAI
ncbi:hypothetical protein BY458DRAFT_507777 [Sporodiniella umbellata]|nr:hypothetical protein BY458DRAFT_507777 [Sporodiniella umbellata]